MALVAVVAAGCTFKTPVPTYWDPVFSDQDKVSLPQWEPYKPRPRKVVRRPPPPPPCKSIFVVSAQRRLFAFDPEDKSFELRGALACPRAGFATPFSMGVARDGIAQVVYNDGRLFRVRTDDAACEAADFTPNQAPGFRQFGMGYAPDGDGESLYVAEIHHYSPSKGLARIDTDSGKLEFIGAFSQNPGYNLELTPTGNGPLYGYFLNRPGRGGTLVKIDTKTADILESTPLDVGTHSASLAIAWWGGDFYIFTGSFGRSQVHRYDPDAGTTELVTTIDQTIVGAGVSTCAPGRKLARH